MGVEPTSTGLQPVAWPSGSSVTEIKRGHQPRGSHCVETAHAFHTMYQTHHQYLTRDSNPVLRFRKPPCIHHTRKASFLRIGKILPARITHHASRITHHTSHITGISTSPGIRTPSCGSEDRRASITLARQTVFSGRSHGSLWKTTAMRNQRQSRRLDSHQHDPLYESGAFLFRATSADIARHTGTASREQRREDSNPVQRLWRPPALPGARRCVCWTHRFRVSETGCETGQPSESILRSLCCLLFL